MLSSEEGFLDIIYLGIFAILSPAFDIRFYQGQKTPSNLLEEATHAVCHFHSLLHVFSQRFFVLLEGEVVSRSYIVDRMLGEFAAAAVVFSKAMGDLQGSDDDDERDRRIATSAFVGLVEGILQESYPNVFPYYSRCLDQGHKHFIWTGPKLQIFPHSEDFNALISLGTAGELLDFPGHQIYSKNLDQRRSQSPIIVAHSQKRRHPDDGKDLANERPEKRKRQP